jgi:hypothetical protein
VFLDKEGFAVSEEATLMGFRNVFFQGMASIILTEHKALRAGLPRALLDGNDIRDEHFERKLSRC